jgi:hypothetical protein
LKKIFCEILKNASNSRPTLQVETLELLPNIMEGAVRECPLLPNFQLISECLTRLQGNNGKMQGKSLFELPLGVRRLEPAGGVSAPPLSFPEPVEVRRAEP